MKLFASHTSPFARKVRVVLFEKRIEYDLVVTDVSNPDHPAAQLNPLGKIPVLLLDDGTAVYDSAVICEYLDTVTPVGRLIPDDPRPRMLVKRWEALADGLMDAAVAIVFEQRRPAGERSAAYLQRQRGKIDQSLQQLAVELGERAYCHGESFTLADAAVGSALFYLDLRFAEVPWREEHPNLQRLTERLEKRKSFEESAVPQA